MSRIVKVTLIYHRHKPIDVMYNNWKSLDFAATECDSVHIITNKLRLLVHGIFFISLWTFFYLVLQVC
jgi:hypothetical protein